MVFEHMSLKSYTSTIQGLKHKTTKHNRNRTDKKNSSL